MGPRTNRRWGPQRPGYWGEETGAAGLVLGGGAKTLSLQKDPESHEYTVTHTLSAHPAAGVALGDQAVKGNNPLGKGGGGEGSEGLDTRRTGGGREEDLEFIKVTSTPASHIQHS